MATRVTVEEVKAILDGTPPADPVISAYITSASTLVTTTFGTGVTDKLKEIERWLSAHMIAITKNRQAQKEGAGGAFIEYTGKYGEGLKSTSYGQMVLSLDDTGKMAGLGGKTASIYAVTSFDS